MNQFHPSDIVAVAVAGPLDLTREVIVAIQQLVARSAGNSVTLEPTNEASFTTKRGERIRGLRIRSSTIEAYEAPVRPASLAPDDFTADSSSVEEYLQDVEPPPSSAISPAEIAPYELSKEIIDRLTCQLQRLGFAPSRDFTLSATDEGHFVALNVQSAMLSDGAIKEAICTQTAGTNPWEVFVCEMDSSELVYSVSDGFLYPMPPESAES